MSDKNEAARVGKFSKFKTLNPSDKRRYVTDLLFNNAMFIIIAIAIIYIAIRVPAFLSLSSIVNIILSVRSFLPFLSESSIYKYGSFLYRYGILVNYALYSKSVSGKS